MYVAQNLQLPCHPTDYYHLLIEIASSKRVEIEGIELPILVAIVEYLYTRKPPKDSLLSNTDMLEV